MVRDTGFFSWQFSQALGRAKLGRVMYRLGRVCCVFVA